ncbi:MAG: Ig-like domain-containing protein [Muribaculaceae bacterium]
MRHILTSICVIAMLCSIFGSCSSELKVISVKINPTTLSIKIGEGKQIYAGINYEGADSVKLNWSSENINIATVSGNGLVKGISAGTTIIKAVCMGLEAECKVNVSTEHVTETPDKPAK